MHRITVVTTRGPSEALHSDVSTVKASLADVTIVGNPELETESRNDTARENPSAKQTIMDSMVRQVAPATSWLKASSSLQPDSSVPALEGTSGDGSGAADTETPNERSLAMEQPKRPVKVSNWRKKRICQTPLIESSESSMVLDFSLVKRRDLPIKLVVDDPMPVGKYNWKNSPDDPYADTMTKKYFKLGRGKKTRQKNKGEKPNTEREIATSPKSVFDNKIGSDPNGGSDNDHQAVAVEGAKVNSQEKVEEQQGQSSWVASFGEETHEARETNDNIQDLRTSTGSWLMPFDPFSVESVCEKQHGDKKKESVPVEGEKRKQNKPNVIQGQPNERQDTLQVESNPQQDERDIPPPPRQDKLDIIRFSGPVVRIQFQGEMVSVSEQTAAKLQEGECAWI